MGGSLALFTAPETIPFGVASALLLAIVLIEGLGALLAASPSVLLDKLLLPETFDSDSLPDGILGWLHVGKVPLLVLFILFLLGFALGGYLTQILVGGLLAHCAPALFATLPAAAVGVFSLRVVGGWLANIIPKDESSAVSEASFIGRSGVVIGAPATRDKAGQVRVRDAHGRSHYLRVEPDVDGDVLEAGTDVLIVNKVGSTYRGIRNPHPGLL